MAAHLRTELVSHTRKVQSLYKRALRNVEAYHMLRHQYRLDAVMLRQRFESHRNEKDMRKAKEILRLGEEELFANQHTHPLKFPYCPGGVAFDRQPNTPDWVLDYWSQTEKDAYPEYFAKREVRKKEFVEFWEKQYGGPDGGRDPGHH